MKRITKVSPEEALEDLKKLVAVDNKEFKGETGMKVVEVKVSGSEREPLILELSPGMTAGNILAEADLADFSLFREAESMKLIPPEEVLFDLLADCETLIARAPVKIDSDEAREDLMSLLIIDDDPPSEPIDTSEDDAYIRSWFKEEDKNAT